MPPGGGYSDYNPHVYDEQFRCADTNAYFVDTLLEE